MLFSDPEIPTLMHWAAKHGFSKMAETLMLLPNSEEASLKLNSQGLNACQLAERHGHNDLANILG
jgi:ankyrin repeat protein